MMSSTNQNRFPSVLDIDGVTHGEYEGKPTIRINCKRRGSITTQEERSILEHHGYVELFDSLANGIDIWVQKSDFPNKELPMIVTMHVLV